MPIPELDELDHRLLAALQDDARLSNVDLAAKVGLSPSPCLRRVKRLEREGFITAHRAVLDRRRMGLGMTVFLGVKLERHANDSAVPFEKAALALPQVVACHMISGDSDYLLEVVVSDLAGYEAFLVGTLLNLSIVREVRSNFAIQTLKVAAPLPLEHLTPTAPEPARRARKARA